MRPSLKISSELYFQSVNIDSHSSRTGPFSFVATRQEMQRKFLLAAATAARDSRLLISRAMVGVWQVRDRGFVYQQKVYEMIRFSQAFNAARCRSCVMAQRDP